MSDTTDSAPDANTDQGATQDQSTDNSTDTKPDSTSDTDLAAEVEKWKNLARKHEDRAKANASAKTELDKLRQSSMSDTEKAVDQARKEALIEAAKTYGSRLVDAEVRTVATGRNLNVDVLLDGLDRSRFLTEDGEPDTESIKTWIDALAPVTRKQADLGQGRRGGPSPKSKEDAFGDFLDANFS